MTDDQYARFKSVTAGIENNLGLQRLVALLLAKLGGDVTITPADEMEIYDRCPIIMSWPPSPDMTERWQLFDKDGKEWADG